MKKKRKNQRKNRNMPGTNHPGEGQWQERFTGLFSFAWLVYPILLKIYGETEDNSNNDTEPEKKKKKKKKKRKDVPVLPNNRIN